MRRKNDRSRLPGAYSRQAGGRPRGARRRVSGARDHIRVAGHTGWPRFNQLWRTAPMKSITVLLAYAAVFFGSLIASRENAAGSTAAADTSTAVASSRTVRLNGASQRVGNGTVRAYIIIDEKDANVPVEVGVALSEEAMEGLPKPKPVDHSAPMVAGEHMDMHNWLLDLPSRNPTPYKFVQFGWNPKGHEPPGVWDTPHFDFHFYTVPVSVRNSIVPSDPQFAEKAAKYPAQELRAPFYLDAAAAAKTTPAAMTVPEMGMHWIDVRTPEVQAMAGKPENYKPFTKTFIYGPWNGEFIFAEPMITRAYLLEKKSATDAAVRDEVIAVPAAGFAEPGYYAQAYRITYDAKTREYRIALTQFSRR